MVNQDPNSDVENTLHDLQKRLVRLEQKTTARHLVGKVKQVELNKCEVERRSKSRLLAFSVISGWSIKISGIRKKPTMFEEIFKPK